MPGSFMPSHVGDRELILGMRKTPMMSHLLGIVSSNSPELTVHLQCRSHVTPRHANAGTAPRRCRLRLSRRRRAGSNRSTSVNKVSELVWYCVLICPIRPSNALLSLGANSLNGKLHHKDKGVSENV